MNALFLHMYSLTIVLTCALKVFSFTDEIIHITPLDVAPLQSQDRSTFASECYSEWKFLSVSVMASNALQGDGDLKKFYICPNTIMTIERPIEILSDGYEFGCSLGPNSEDGTNCIIKGGWSHFKIAGTVSKVLFRNLTFTESTVASIIAAGSKDSVVDFMYCVWSSNEGHTAILVYNEAKGVPVTKQVIISDLVESREPSMAVRCTGCIFAKNQHIEHGVILNFGGQVSFKDALFVGNTVNIGLISSKYNGIVAITDSCFLINEALLSGIIRVDEGGLLTSNKDTFGLNNTARFGSCNQILLEVGESCAGNNAVQCIGVCADFTAQSCIIDLRESRIKSVLESVDIEDLRLDNNNDDGKNINTGGKTDEPIKPSEENRPQVEGTNDDEPPGKDWNLQDVQRLIYIIGGTAAGALAICAATTVSCLICRIKKKNRNVNYVAVPAENKKDGEGSDNDNEKDVPTGDSAQESKDKESKDKESKDKESKDVELGLEESEREKLLKKKAKENFIEPKKKKEEKTTKRLKNDKKKQKSKLSGSDDNKSSNDEGGDESIKDSSLHKSDESKKSSGKGSKKHPRSSSQKKTKSNDTETGLPAPSSSSSENGDTINSPEPTPDKKKKSKGIFAKRKSQPKSDDGKKEDKKNKMKGSGIFSILKKTNEGNESSSRSNDDHEKKKSDMTSSSVHSKGNKSAKSRQDEKSKRSKQKKNSEGDEDPDSSSSKLRSKSRGERDDSRSRGDDSRSRRSKSRSRRSKSRSKRDDSRSRRSKSRSKRDDSRSRRSKSRSKRDDSRSKRDDSRSKRTDSSSKRDESKSKREAEKTKSETKNNEKRRRNDSNRRSQSSSYRNKNDTKSETKLEASNHDDSTLDSDLNTKRTDPTKGRRSDASANSNRSKSRKSSNFLTEMGGGIAEDSEEDDSSKDDSSVKANPDTDKISEKKKISKRSVADDSTIGSSSKVSRIELNQQMFENSISRKNLKSPKYSRARSRERRRRSSGGGSRVSLGSSKEPSLEWSFNKKN